MENPPKLSEEELQKLLADAHFPLRSRLSTLREEEEKEEESGEWSGKGGVGQIKREGGQVDIMIRKYQF